MKPKTNPRLWSDLHNPYRYRDDNLRAMGFPSYADYLQSPLWASIRARVVADAGGVCSGCGADKGVQVHHRAYDPATLKGEQLHAMSALCFRCHSRMERAKDWLEPYDHFQRVNWKVLQRNRSQRAAVRASVAVGPPRLVRRSETK